MRDWRQKERLGLDPLAPLDFRVAVVEPLTEQKRGAPVRVLPLLHSPDGLLIIYGYRGSPASPGASQTTIARVVLATSEGAEVDAATSGFS